MAADDDVARRKTAAAAVPAAGLVTLAVNPPLSVAVAASVVAATIKKNVLVVVEVAVSRPPDHVVSVVDHAAEEAASEVGKQHVLMLSNCDTTVLSASLLLCAVAGLHLSTTLPDYLSCSGSVRVDVGLLAIVENAREWLQTTTSLVGKLQPQLYRQQG